MLSSPYCRCKDTAELAFGRLRVVDSLQFSISKNRQESDRLAAYLRDLMMTAPLGNDNTVIVGHTSNLRDAFGVWPKPEGVAVVFERSSTGLEPLGMIAPDQWHNLAQ